MKLNQVIALVQGKKARAVKTHTEAYRWQADLLKGISRTYKPLDDNGEMLPAENKVVPLHAEEVMKSVVNRMSEFYNVVATQEIANQDAQADIVIDNKNLLTGIPVTVLLFFDKQLVDMLKFARSLPVLPIDKAWTWEQQRGCWITEPEETTRTQKVPQVLSKAPATIEHKEQVDVWNKDVVVGHWNTTHMSGALPKKTKDGIINRIEKLQDAVKQAREKANGLDVPKMSKAGEIFIRYIFKSDE